MQASERQGNSPSVRQASPPPRTPRGCRKSLPGEFPRLGAAACPPPAVPCPSPVPPTANKATGLPPRRTSGTSRTRVARTRGRGCGGARPGVGETRSGVEQATKRTGWRGQRRGGARGSALSARPRTRSRRHLSRSAARGPPALVARTPGSGSSLADSPCSRGASPPEAETRSAAGRRSRPRWPRHRPRSPCRRRHRASDGRELAGLPRPSRPRGRGRPPTGRSQPPGSRGRVPLCTCGSWQQNLELRRRRQGAKGGGKAHPWEICPTEFIQKGSESPREETS